MYYIEKTGKPIAIFSEIGYNTLCIGFFIRQNTQNKGEEKDYEKTYFFRYCAHNAD